MSPADPTRDRSARPFNPRMHERAKLCFRGRAPDGGGDPGPFLRIGGENPPRLAELVPEGLSRVEVEIGPGKGAFVLAAVAKKPDTFVLGIEAARGYANRGATKLQKAGAANGLFLVDNGKLFLEDRVDEGELDALHVLFPDPWPKRRHQARRFFTEDVCHVIARAVRDDGFCYIATDNAAYAGQIARIMGSSAAFVREEDEEARAIAEGPGYAFSPTNFERKYLLEGRIIRRYAFRRCPR